MEPFGPQADWHRHATAMTWFANVHRSSEAEPYRHSDFMPNVPEVIETPAEYKKRMKAEAVAVAAMFRDAWNKPDDGR